jgi:hypothetical protein
MNLKFGIMIPFFSNISNIPFSKCTIRRDFSKIKIFRVNRAGYVHFSTIYLPRNYFILFNMLI